MGGVWTSRSLFVARKDGVGRWTAMLLTVLMSTSVASTLAAQDDDLWDEEVRQHGIFLDSLDVSLINIEVYAEQDGSPVTDLEVTDFELLDDGKPMKISHFQHVRNGRKVRGGLEELSVVSGSQAAEEAVEPREPSTLVILVDQPFLAPAAGQMVFERISGQLESIVAQGTRMLVVSKHRKVEIVQPMTSDLSAVRESLEQLVQQPGTNSRMEVARIIQSITSGPTEGLARSGPGGAGGGSKRTSLLDARSAYQQARNHSQEMHTEMQLSLSLLRKFLSSLAGLPGRKALLYVADRLPTRPGELVWQAWFQKFGFDWGPELGAASVDAAIAEFDTTAAVRELIADANAGRVAFYPIGIGADAGPSLTGAESRGVSVGGAGRAQFREQDSGLQWLAERTGGRAAIGRGDVDTFFAGLQSDLTDYYSLAYASPHRGDGKTHRIEVRVRRPGVKIRYLEEYRDKSADQQMADRTLSSVMLGTRANPLDAKVELGKAKRQKDGLYRLPIEVQVPMANLVLLPGEIAHSGKLTLVLVVSDQDGGLSDPVRVRLPFEVKNVHLMEALSSTFEYPTELLIRRGRQVLGVSLRDDLADVGSTLTVEVEVGS